LKKYTKGDILYELIVGDDAALDLEKILVKHPDAGYRIAVVIQEIMGSQSLLEKLSWDRYGGKPHLPEGDAVMSISKWQALYRKGFNIWRLRDFELSHLGYEYRMVYAYIPSKDLYFVLAIVERAFDYEQSHPVTQRVINAYKRLDADGWW
jgi:hypothetical protein